MEFGALNGGTWKRVAPHPGSPPNPTLRGFLERFCYTDIRLTCGQLVMDSTGSPSPLPGKWVGWKVAPLCSWLLPLLKEVCLSWMGRSDWKAQPPLEQTCLSFYFRCYFKHPSRQNTLV